MIYLAHINWSLISFGHKKYNIQIANHLTDGLVCLCTSYRGISNKLIYFMTVS